MQFSQGTTSRPEIYLKIYFLKSLRFNRTGFQSAAIHEHTILLSYGSELCTGHKHRPSDALSTGITEGI